MIEIQVKINSIEEALKIVKLAERLDNDIDFTNGRVVVDAKSIIGVLSADFSKPCNIIILGNNNDDGVENFINSIKEHIIKVEEMK